MTETPAAGPPSQPSPTSGSAPGLLRRSVYVYSMVRSGVIGLIALVALPTTIAGGAPWWVPLLCGLLVVLMGVRLWQVRKRWHLAQTAFAASPRA